MDLKNNESVFSKEETSSSVLQFDMLEVNGV